MFGLLKNKLSNFIKGLAGREESKGASSEKVTSPAEALQQVEKTEAFLPQEKTAPPVQMPQQEKKPEQVSPQEKSPPLAQAVPKAKIEPTPAQAAAVEKKTETTHEEKTLPKEAAHQKIEKTETKFEELQPAVAPQKQEEHKKSILDSVASVFAPKKHKQKDGQPKIESSSPPVQQPKQEFPKTTGVQQEPEAPKPTIAEPEQTPVPRPMQSPAPKFETPKTEVPKQAPSPVHKAEPPKAGSAKPSPLPAPAPKADYDLSRLEKKAHEEKRGMAPKIGIGAAIKSFFSNEITIGEGEVSDLLEELELSLLEADVAYDVSLEVTSQLRNRLVGMKVPKGEVESRTKATITQVLEGVMESERNFDFIQRVKSCRKPVKILFVGPNGAGKTTTMAKVARMLLDSGLTVVFSASDTFRAAAIEQTEVHAGRLGIKAIKSKYGADPSSVAFDAINFAKANSVDVVLVDSAGRQDTNANLLSELKKINRVAQPDIKLYVGESIGGNSIIEQIKAFNEAIGLDGAILTKIDCDAKGGTAISIAKTTGIPIVFLGVGQGYSDLVPFDAHKLAQEIMT
ncbi:MAG: signal recognition particle-docking protein FtsY [Candidatus Anstonellaceae archaeon]